MSKSKRRRLSKNKLRDNYRKEQSWSDCSGARYILDTVAHHEQDTSCQYRINKLLELVNGLTLDVGCGTGGVSMLLGSKAKVVALDFLMEPLMEANSKQNLLQKGEYSEGWDVPFCHPPNYKPDCMWVCAELNFLPFISDVFDTVVMSECIEHLPVNHRQRVISIIEDILKNDGNLVISTPLVGTEGSHPYGLCSKRQLKAYIEDGGLKLVEYEEVTFHGVKTAYLVAKK